MPLTFALTSPAASAETPARWAIVGDGGIAWEVKAGDAHTDHIEMSGLRVSAIVTYGADAAGKLSLSRHIVWPMLRFQPNKTRDHLALTFGEDAAPRIFLDGLAPRNERLVRVHHQGIARFEGTYGRNQEIAYVREIFPSTDKPAVIETLTFTNRSARPATIECEENTRAVHTNAARGIDGDYTATSRVLDPGVRTLAPGKSATFTLMFEARRRAEPAVTIDAAAERVARASRIAGLLDRLQLETPDPVLNTAFAFAKIRAAESIYATKGGLMHGPGGGAYYAAIWANDQAEYANPFFAMLGDPTATESAVNAFRHFARYVNPDYKPIPSSIVAEGAGFWHGAKDRGDMAMIAYGAARFALAYGDRKTAAELWPLIEWCLEYCRRKLNVAGVVASDSDELENRFPAGDANLCTSSLYYDALQSAALLGRDLGKPAGQLEAYAAGAGALRTAIERHFGSRVEGFDTYRYYDGNTVLRAWICIPLTVGLYERAEGTVAALFSPRLWTADGLATEAGRETFWDRSTLYALRGVFAAGSTQQALDYLTYYSRRRLLGEHVPYPVEAYPEGNQRHLSAESALYGRIFTEGVFGLRPTGLRSFSCTPRLPMGWDRMALKRVHAFGAVFDVTVSRTGDRLRLTVRPDNAGAQTYELSPGASASVVLGP